MKRSEFVPGVLFHLPGSTFSVYRYRVLGKDTTGIYAVGYLNKEGNLVEYREQQFFHLDFNNRGFKLWQSTASVYLYSNTIRFDDLKKVELPSPSLVTNPVSI